MAVEGAAPEACDLLVEAGHVVPVEPHGVVLEDHAVAVRGGAIVAEALRGASSAVLVLGDMSGSRGRAPQVVPWSNSRSAAPLRLQRTVEEALALLPAPEPLIRP